jgi:hypothetical protein
MKASNKIPDRLFIAEGKNIELILKRAVRHALLEHKRAGNTIAVWEDGRVALIPAEEIIINEHADDIAED